MRYYKNVAVHQLENMCFRNAKKCLIIVADGLMEHTWFLTWFFSNHSKSGLRIEIGGHLPLCLAPKRSKTGKTPYFVSFRLFFLSKMGSNVTQFQFWDQIWRIFYPSLIKAHLPLIKAHLLNPKMNGVLILYFLTQLRFQNFGCQGQGRDENFREIKHANVFPQIPGMIKS